jgi:hypothetical protein
VRNVPAVAIVLAGLLLAFSERATAVRTTDELIGLLETAPRGTLEQEWRVSRFDIDLPAPPVDASQAKRLLVALEKRTPVEQRRLLALWESGRRWPPETILTLMDTVDRWAAGKADVPGVTRLLEDTMRGPRLDDAEFARLCAWMSGQSWLSGGTSGAPRKLAVYTFGFMVPDDPRARQAIACLMQEIEYGPDRDSLHAMQNLQRLTPGNPLDDDQRTKVLDLIRRTADLSTRMVAFDLLLPGARNEDKNLQQLSSAFLYACMSDRSCGDYAANVKLVVPHRLATAEQRAQLEAAVVQIVATCERCLDWPFAVDDLLARAYEGPRITVDPGTVEELTHGDLEARFRAALRMRYAAAHGGSSAAVASAFAQVLKDSSNPPLLCAIAEQMLGSRFYGDAMPPSEHPMLAVDAATPSERLTFAADAALPEVVRVNALLSMRSQPTGKLTDEVEAALRKLATDDTSYQVRDAAGMALKAYGIRRPLGNVLESSSFRHSVSQGIGWTLITLFAIMAFIWFCVVLAGPVVLKHWWTRVLWLGWSVAICVPLFYGGLLGTMGMSGKFLLATLALFCVNFAVQMTLFVRGLRRQRSVKRDEEDRSEEQHQHHEAREQ